MVIACMAKAQGFYPGLYPDYSYSRMPALNISLPDSARAKKWSVTKYSSISTSFMFFNGGSATMLSAPLGLQLNRKLNNNLYAFAGVAVAPSYVNFGRSFTKSNFSKAGQQNGMFNAASLGIYSRAELGLMYVNDEKTFSISGSIGVQRGSYPMMPYNQNQNPGVNPVISAAR